LGSKKLEWCPYQTVKKFEDMSIGLDTIGYGHWADGQTDGVAITILRSACMAC